MKSIYKIFIINFIFFICFQLNVLALSTQDKETEAGENLYESTVHAQNVLLKQIELDKLNLANEQAAIVAVNQAEAAAKKPQQDTIKITAVNNSSTAVAPSTTVVPKHQTNTKKKNSKAGHKRKSKRKNSFVNKREDN
jgi:hypothetical protein